MSIELPRFGGFAGRGRLDILRDHAYGPHPLQRVDVYRRHNLSDGGVIVFVHGGAWAMGDKANPGVVQGKLARWVPQGCVLVSVNYRLLPEAGPAEQANDLARALANIQRALPQWGGNAKRLGLVGHSTGAHLSALLHADRGLRDRHGVLPWAGTVLLDTAVFDVPRIMSAPHRPLYDRAFGDDPGLWPQVSPWHRLDGPTGPLQIVSGTTHELGFEEAQRFARRALELGGDAEALRVELGHAEINRLLGIEPSLTAAVEGFLGRVGILA